MEETTVGRWWTLVQTTVFDQRKWNLKTFNKIGYDHEQSRLYIFHLNGTIVEFSNIEEEQVYKLVISVDKERFIRDTLCQSIPHRVIYEEASLSS